MQKNHTLNLTETVAFAWSRLEVVKKRKQEIDAEGQKWSWEKLCRCCQEIWTQRNQLCWWTSGLCFPI